MGLAQWLLKNSIPLRTRLSHLLDNILQRGGFIAETYHLYQARFKINVILQLCLQLKPMSAYVSLHRAGDTSPGPLHWDNFACKHWIVSLRYPLCPPCHLLFHQITLLFFASFLFSSFFSSLLLSANFYLICAMHWSGHGGKWSNKFVRILALRSELMVYRGRWPGKQ